MPLMSPLTPIGILELAKTSVTYLISLLECDRLTAHPIILQVCLPFTNTPYGLFTTRIREINRKDLGNIPRGMPGYKKVAVASKWQLSAMCVYA